MIRFALYDKNGRIVQCGSARSIAEVPSLTGLTARVVAEGVTDATHWFDGSEVVRFPPKPADGAHEWSWARREWVTDRAAARRQLQARIDAMERGQGRAMREAALGKAGARERLEAMDAEIRALAGQMAAL